MLFLLRKMKRAKADVFGGLVEAFQSSVDAVRYAGHVVVPSGILLMFVSGWPWKSFWVLATCVLLIGSLVFLAKAFKPKMKSLGTDAFDLNVHYDRIRGHTLI